MQLIFKLDDKEMEKLIKTGHLEIGLDRSIDCKNLTCVVIQKAEESK